MKVFRPLHWLFARLLGYFWQPCPKCGRGFGGHQIARQFRRGSFGGTAIPHEEFTVLMLQCHRCTATAKAVPGIPGTALPKGVTINMVFPKAKYALLSGRICMVPGVDVMGWPPDFMGGWEGIALTLKFWRRYFFGVNISVGVLVFVSMVTSNPWAQIGVALCFLFQCVALRAVPVDPTRPGIMVIMYSVNVLVIAVNVASAMAKWKKM